MPNTTTTVLQQLLHLLPRHDFQSFVGQHKADKYTKRLSCWNQLTILLYAQATEKDSLREIETGLLVRNERWYHLGLSTCARSTLARANEKRQWSIYESLFYKLLERCKNLGSGTASTANCEIHFMAYSCCFSFRPEVGHKQGGGIPAARHLAPWAEHRRCRAKGISPLRSPPSGVHRGSGGHFGRNEEGEAPLGRNKERSLP